MKPSGRPTEAALPVMLTEREREVLLDILMRTPTPNHGYREFMSAIDKIAGRSPKGAR